MLDAYPAPIPLFFCPKEPLLGSDTKLSPPGDFGEAFIISYSKDSSWEVYIKHSINTIRLARDWIKN